MTREEFIKITGMAPMNDDLERVNCPKAGQFGHKLCGVCPHGGPRFGCFTRDDGTVKFCMAAEV